MESWLSILVRLIVVALVATVVGTALQSTSNQLVTKLFNPDSEATVQHPQPSKAVLSSNWAGVAGGLATFLIALFLMQYLQFRRFSNTVSRIGDFGGSIRFTPQHESRLFAYIYSESTVDLSDSDSNDSEFPKLVALPRLRTLRVANTKLSNNAAVQIAKCKMLKSLDLSSTNVEDSTFSLLGTLRSLKHLLVNDTALTDHSVATILNFDALEKLECKNTAITSEGIGRIHTQFPELNIANPAGVG